MQRLADTQKLVEACNRLAVELFRLSGDSGGNFVTAPFSLYQLLIAAESGARGKSAEVLREYLHPGIEISSMLQSCLRLNSALHPVNAGSSDAGGVSEREGLARGLQSMPAELRSSFSLFGTDQTLKQGLRADVLKDQYLSVLRGFFRRGGSVTAEYLSSLRSGESEFSLIDFSRLASEPGETLKGLYAGERERGSLSDSFGESLILMGSAFYRSSWMKKFNKRFTRTAPFTLRDGSKTNVRMMLLTSLFVYGETEDMQILKMGYEMMDQSMILLLPRDQEKLGRVAKNMSPEYLDEVLNNTKPAIVRAYVPRFSLDSFRSVKEDLVSLGLGGIFDDESDFSGISGNLRLLEVLLDTTIDLSEKGSGEASEVRNLVVRGYPPKTDMEYTFRADRPFIFVVRDNTSSCILFLGKVGWDEGCFLSSFRQLESDF